MLNILKVDLMASIDSDAVLAYTIGRMEIKLTEAKKSTKKGNFSEQEQIIENLKKVRHYLQVVEQNNLILLKEAKKVLAENSNIELRIKQILNERAKLEKELEQIKNNLSPTI